VTTTESESNNIDWEEIILRLQAFTKSLVKRKRWFRGTKGEILLAGKEMDDYVFGAIEAYLSNPQKFDSSKGSLVDYLNYNLVRSLVSRDSVSAENATSHDVFGIADKKANDDDSETYLDRTLPYVEALFDQEIDYKKVMEFVENEAKKDPIVENIFLGLNIFDLKRREIIQEFSMTESDYDNGMRRLKTILKNAAEKFDLKPSSQ
jgi:hypothetical protein